jgi:hypothetical protein
MKAIFAVVIFSIATNAGALAADQRVVRDEALHGGFVEGRGFIPDRGFVPDAATAEAVARALLVPIYGAKRVQSEEPFKATRNGDVWTVKGTLNCPMTLWDRIRGASCMGGTAIVKLAAKSGQVLYLIHMQ